jgi:hypothetical protein
MPPTDGVAVATLLSMSATTREIKIGQSAQNDYERALIRCLSRCNTGSDVQRGRLNRMAGYKDIEGFWQARSCTDK